MRGRVIVLMLSSAIDELDALALETRERPRDVGDLEAQVMHRGAASLGDEAGDPRFAIRRLEELDARRVARGEHDAHALVRDDVLAPDGVPEDVTVEGDRIGEGRYRDADVVERAGLDQRHPRR